MTATLGPMLNEFHEEASVTRRVLERVPEDKLLWKPHAKSMTLGQLAIHIAMVPGSIAKITQPDSFDVLQGSFTPPQPATVKEILTAFEQCIRDVEECLEGTTEQASRKDWRLMMGEKELFCLPRIDVLRSLMLNHWYHHRGQLSVYLRLLDVPLPAIYGPSADEMPFG